jgi:predicted PhzF superfamily epimerase YddE/YHI9
MRKLTIAVLDSFTDKPFSGNPAAVCLLDSPLSKEQMQAIAMEMNLSETAFVEKTKEEGSFSLRWFTPMLEIDLCGHATLASAFWMYSQGWAKEGDEIKFQTLSGVLRVTKQGDLICMNFPLIPTQVLKKFWGTKSFRRPNFEKIGFLSWPMRKRCAPFSQILRRLLRTVKKALLLLLLERGITT